MHKNWNSLRLVALAAVVLAASPAFAQEEASAPSAPTLPDYTIGIQDVLRIVVWDEPELNQTLTVRPDGKITMPLINDISVIGRTPGEVREMIASDLGNYVQDPSVTVIVDQINSYTVYFLGEVSAQGAVPFARPIRLLQAIASVGGLTEFAKNEIWLLREENGTERRIRIDYRRLAAGDPRQENLLLLPGDTVIVE